MRLLFKSVIIALICAGTARGQCPLTFQGSNQALIGVYIAPIGGGKALADYNSTCMFTPASVLKSVTVAAAMAKYPADYRWQTDVMAVGRVNDGNLEGDLLVRGSGDPTLDSESFRDDRESFLSAIRTGLQLAGIKSVSGSVKQLGKGWPNEGPIPSWELEDIPGIDGAGFYALNYSDNVFLLSYPSLTTQPEMPDLEIKYGGGSSALWFNRKDGSNVLTVYGRLPARQKRASFKCSMPDPPAALLFNLNKNLPVKRRDVTPVADTLVIATYQSPPLKDVARSLMIRSDNQMAEATLRLLAPGSTRAAALAEELRVLSNRGANLENARIKDGSGLSRHNAISPRQICSVLAAMAGNRDYVDTYARVGMDGSTVRSFMKGVPGRENFLLKSGSMTGVVAYVGYRIDPAKKVPTHVIAMIVNNAPDAGRARAAMAALLSSLKF